MFHLGTLTFLARRHIISRETELPELVPRGGSTASSSVGTVSIGFTTAIIGGKLKIVRGSLTVVSQSASVTRGLFSRCSSSAQGYCGGASPAAASATWS